jgi:hypothetical protein
MLRVQGNKFRNHSERQEGPHDRLSPSYLVVISCATAANGGKEPTLYLGFFRCMRSPR